jgi:alkyl sulfatase BDS1-like metallo-beta-lactamase superfamily hydrolase
MNYGLFEVVEGIYQIRGFDISNMTLIAGDTGWIVIDPLMAAETAKAGMDLVREHLPERPVVAVIYTHSHTDHFGGIKGVVTEEEVLSGDVKVIAPEGFLEHAISENVFAGNAMSRRSVYQFGPLLSRGIKGQVDAGLGKTVATGTVTLIPPTDIVTETGQTMTVDGVDIIFQNAPGSEAPAEMMFYFPQFKALCLSEDACRTLHNLYTLRGAQIRDPLAWSRYLNETLELFGDKAEVAFASHHWPTWGQANIVDLVKKQRDVYKYIHDQTLRLMNQGYTMIEIAEMLELPESLSQEWYNRGYYGTVSHDVKAVYQRYLGWFDANPAHLHPLPPVESAKKYVEFMGGAEAVLGKARHAFEEGDYRWVAEVVNHVVFAAPDNTAARRLQADALEQLGYQAESAIWRNFYLVGASELREGLPDVAGGSSASPDMIAAMTIDLLFDFMAIHVNGPQAAGEKFAFNLIFTDTGEQYVMTLENSVLNYTKGKQLADADTTIILSREALDHILTGNERFLRAIRFLWAIIVGDIQIQGDWLAIIQLSLLMDSFDLWFNIVTP